MEVHSRACVVDCLWVRVCVSRMRVLWVGVAAYVATEIEILKSTNHPSIIKLYDVVLTAAHAFCVTERATGGEVRVRAEQRRHSDICHQL